jgi:hypothetical protein
MLPRPPLARSWLVTDPKNIVEHHWRTSDLVVWDNIALQHARPNVTAEGPARTLRKASETMFMDASMTAYADSAFDAAFQAFAGVEII